MPAGKSLLRSTENAAWQAIRLIATAWTPCQAACESRVALARVLESAVPL